MKKNRVAVIFLVLAMSVMPSFSAFAAYEAADIFITVDGLFKKSEVQPVISDGNTMVSLREISDILNVQPDWNQETKTVTVKMPGRLIEMTVGDKISNINYEKVEMPTAPIIVNDRVMVPLRFICEKCKLKVDWNEEKHIVALSTGKQAYSVLEARPEVELGEGDVELTFEKAIEQINANNSTLKDMRDKLEIMKRNKKEKDEYIRDYVGAIGNGLSKVYTYEEIGHFREQRTIDNSFKTMQYNEVKIKDSNEMQLYSALSDIEKTDLDMYMLEEKIKLDEINLENMQLKLSLGLETESNIKSLENDIAKNKISLNLLEIKQSNNNLALNKLVGVNAAKKVKITGTDDKTEVFETDLEAFVKDQLKNSPSVLLKTVDLDNATWVKTTYYELLFQYLREDKTDDNKEPMQVVKMESDIAAAQRALDDTKIALEQKIRTNYNSIKQLEQNYESLKVDFDIAKNAYEKVVMNYVTGYATIFDVQQAKFGLLKAEADMQANRINYKTAVESFKLSYLTVGQQME